MGGGGLSRSPAPPGRVRTTPCPALPPNADTVVRMGLTLSRIGLRQGEPANRSKAAPSKRRFRFSRRESGHAYGSDLHVIQRGQDRGNDPAIQEISWPRRRTAGRCAAGVGQPCDPVRDAGGLGRVAFLRRRRSRGRGAAPGAVLRTFQRPRLRGGAVHELFRGSRK
jgi:hypothetical protein